MTSKQTADTTAEVPTFEHLLVLDDCEPRPGAVNMALDEVLLNASAGGSPLLRFYYWDVPTVSYGYFEPFADALRLARGRRVVRRMTGGGLVEHGDDLTYTLVVPRPDPLVNMRSAETYRIIHAAVAMALAQVGVKVGSHTELGSTTASSDENACFRRPVMHDLVANGVKVAGGAQRRTRAGLLHQGSIRFASGSGDSWMRSMRRALPSALALQTSERSIAAAELIEASHLASTKYATGAWTSRR